MANLSYADLKKRDNANKFIDKTFGRGDNENNWNGDGGLFLSDSVEIGKEVYKQYDVNLPTILTSAAKNPGIFLYGKFSGQRSRKKVNLTKLFKSKEFGGQGPKGNAGHAFERQLTRRLDECLSSICCRGRYDDASKHLIDILSSHVGSPVKSAKLEGGANTPRPIKVSSGIPYIDPKTPSKHGQLLTDITVTHKDGTESYLSLKTSKTITFINSGVSKNYFTQDDMAKGIVSLQPGIALLDAFGLNNALFCKVFNKYNKGEKFPTMEIHPDKQKLNSFMQTAIGANYHMIHELSGKVYYWWVGTSENKNFADVSSSKMIAYYGGKSGKGKRIDIEFSNRYYKFKVNIRNKQSGVYPSHIMLDYESLPAIGKTIL